MAGSKVKIEPEILDADETAEMQEELERSAEGLEQMRAALVREQEENARLREQAAGQGHDGEPDEGQHVIDLGGRLRRAWRFWQFRLFALAVVQGAGAVLMLNGAGGGAALFGLLNWVLFAAWSMALFRKRGLGQMFLKWVIYLAAVAAGGAVAFNMAEGQIPASAQAQWVFEGSVLAALLLTLSKLSDWLAEWIHEHIWESAPVQTVKGWFV